MLKTITSPKETCEQSMAQKEESKPNDFVEKLIPMWENMMKEITKSKDSKDSNNDNNDTKAVNLQNLVSSLINKSSNDSMNNQTLGDIAKEQIRNMKEKTQNTKNESLVSGQSTVIPLTIDLGKIFSDSQKKSDSQEKQTSSHSVCSSSPESPKINIGEMFQSIFSKMNEKREEQARQQSEQQSHQQSHQQSEQQSHQQSSTQCSDSTKVNMAELFTKFFGNTEKYVDGLSPETDGIRVYGFTPKNDDAGSHSNETSEKSEEKTDNSDMNSSRPQETKVIDFTFEYPNDFDDKSIDSLIDKLNNDNTQPTITIDETNTINENTPTIGESQDCSSESESF